MLRYFFLSALFFAIVAGCQNEQTMRDAPDEQQDENTEGAYEEDERFQPITGNDDQPEPVAANYLNAANCDSVTETVTFKNHIQAIVDTRCAVSACHDAVTKANGINMDGYANARAVFEHGKGFCSIMHDFEARCKHMPTVRIKLPDRDIAKILCWAKTGYAE